MSKALYSLAVLAISATSTPLVGAQNPKAKSDALLVYGSGFAFSVKEPAGWTADTNELARHYGVNVVFVPQASRSRKLDVTVRIRVNRKVDENTEQDLKADMDDYKDQYPTVRFEDLALKHETYQTFPKLFFVTDRFYEYVAYLNPGKDVPMVFSFALSKRAARASADELAAFSEIIQSFAFLTKDVIK